MPRHNHVRRHRQAQRTGAGRCGPQPKAPGVTSPARSAGGATSSARQMYSAGAVRPLYRARRSTLVNSPPREQPEINAGDARRRFGRR